MEENHSYRHNNNLVHVANKLFDERNLLVNTKEEVLDILNFIDSHYVKGKLTMYFLHELKTNDLYDACENLAGYLWGFINGRWEIPEEQVMMVDSDGCKIMWYMDPYTKSMIEIR